MKRKPSTEPSAMKPLPAVRSTGKAIKALNSSQKAQGPFGTHQEGSSKVLSPLKKRRLNGGRAPGQKTLKTGREVARVMKPLNDIQEDSSFQTEDAVPFRVENDGEITVGHNELPNGNYSLDLSESFKAYQEAVLASFAGFYQIAPTWCVVQGWNAQDMQCTSKWFHFYFRETGNTTDTYCECRPHILSTECVHSALWRLNKEVLFPEEFDSVHTDDDTISTTLFLRTQIQLSHYLNHLSVGCDGHTSRAIVTFKGSDTGDGKWSCNKDSGQRCIHIEGAYRHMQKLFNYEEDLDDLIQTEKNPQPRKPAVEDMSVSHQRIPPPRWSWLPNEDFLATTAPPARAPLLNVVLRLKEGDLCHLCSSIYQSDSRVVTRECKVFTLLSVVTCEIEVQPCPGCPAARHRHIGPDLGSIGIFNLNNLSLFSHKLLNEYSSAFSLSETPFSAFVTHIDRWYQSQGESFIGDELFRTAWFGYARLLLLDNDLECPSCGPSPEDVIFDGVTLAFGVKHLQSVLAPPTALHESSKIRDKTIYYASQQFIVVTSVQRKDIAAIVNISDASGPIIEPHVLQEHQELCNRVSTALKDVLPEFQELLFREFGTSAVQRNCVGGKIYRDLCKQIAADESALTMVNARSLEAISNFLLSPGWSTGRALAGVPAVYAAVDHELRKSNEVSSTLLNLIAWMKHRGEQVLAKLRTHEVLETTQFPHDSNWQQTGCCYGMPPIRHRPKYPKLRHENLEDSTPNRGGKCSKFYNTYGKAKLTGGIMAAWCTHSICLGFHCIPSAEGRNDVFSALITRWPIAPKRVIYDFACALGPYCMLREAKFFENTQFLIDNFHSQGHTKCSKASFLSTYSLIDPSLRGVNSSAAECGNSAIKRIRKSVSYMGQQRAIVYTRIFLSFWNRAKILRLEVDRSRNGRY